jgi:chromate reductase
MRKFTGETVRIVGISGSLRKASFSTALLKVLAANAPLGIEIEVVTLEEIPLYNEDLDAEPAVPAVTELKKRIAESDGVLIATPEYNHGIPGVLKNALDWVSRPAFTGGVRAQYQLRETLISMHAHLVMGPEVVVGGVHRNLVDDVYTDERGIAFMLASLDRLREEILSRRLVTV